MFLYETHLHTAPVSRCARTDVETALRFYHGLGYDGVFITNHFLDGNINIDRTLPYDEKLRFYLSDYERGVELGKSIGIKVFFGVEMSYGGTDFLVYGLEPQWYFDNPQIMDMPYRKRLEYLRECGALVIQAHPFRQAAYIDHIRIFPEVIDGIEVLNACRTDRENRLARIYAEEYDLLRLAGSDNHNCDTIKKLAGIATHAPLHSVGDFIDRVRGRETEIFTKDIGGEE